MAISIDPEELAMSGYYELGSPGEAPIRDQKFRLQHGGTSGERRQAAARSLAAGTKMNQQQRAAEWDAEAARRKQKVAEANAPEAQPKPPVRRPAAAPGGGAWGQGIADSVARAVNPGMPMAPAMPSEAEMNDFPPITAPTTPEAPTSTLPTLQPGDPTVTRGYSQGGAPTSPGATMPMMESDLGPAAPTPRPVMPPENEVDDLMSRPVSPAPPGGYIRTSIPAEQAWRQGGGVQGDVSGRIEDTFKQQGFLRSADGRTAVDPVETEIESTSRLTPDYSTPEGLRRAGEARVTMGNAASYLKKRGQPEMAEKATTLAQTFADQQMKVFDDQYGGKLKDQVALMREGRLARQGDATLEERRKYHEGTLEGRDADRNLRGGIEEQRQKTRMGEGTRKAAREAHESSFKAAETAYSKAAATVNQLRRKSLNAPEADPGEVAAAQGRLNAAMTDFKAAKKALDDFNQGETTDDEDELGQEVNRLMQLRPDISRQQAEQYLRQKAGG